MGIDNSKNSDFDGVKWPIVCWIYTISRSPNGISKDSDFILWYKTVGYFKGICQMAGASDLPFPTGLNAAKWIAEPSPNALKKARDTKDSVLFHFLSDIILRLAIWMNSRDYIQQIMLCSFSYLVNLNRTHSYMQITLSYLIICIVFTTKLSLCLKEKAYCYMCCTLGHSPEPIKTHTHTFMHRCLKS